MGHRKFYDQVLEDIIHYDTYKITDQIDVTTLKDYMQVNLEKNLRHVQSKKKNMHSIEGDFSYFSSLMNQINW